MVGVYTVRVAAAAAILALTAGCSSDEPTPAVAAPAPTTTQDPVVATQNAQHDMSKRLCADLERLGQPYYENVHEKGWPTASSSPEDFGKALAWTVVLTSIGAEEGEIDGQGNIVKAAPPVRDAMLTLTRKAGPAGQRLSYMGAGGIPFDPFVTAEVSTALTEAAAACQGAGVKPSWF